ncbi:SRPBCC family protein [Streptosporangium sandarakinum]|uniref:Putative membrane protein n=1 Tax=Streptosporangium sandarakinum TaxID=1260955 RepID=A0A852VBQ3_9ACTN|nr:SRPBCC family protein [Streptosporangium sandarakinum]NYF43555.1 putative membrane protein [Streptosporangium sandarakinum]
MTHEDQHTADPLARVLGWAGLGLGLAHIVAPKTAGRVYRRLAPTGGREFIQAMPMMGGTSGRGLRRRLMPTGGREFLYAIPSPGAGGRLRGLPMAGGRGLPRGLRRALAPTGGREFLHVIPTPGARDLLHMTPPGTGRGITGRIRTMLAPTGRREFLHVIPYPGGRGHAHGMGDHHRMGGMRRMMAPGRGMGGMTRLMSSGRMRAGRGRRGGAGGRIGALTAATGLAAAVYAAARIGRRGTITREQQGRELGERVRDLRAAVTINQPREEVYRYWRDFGHLPRFMTHLESVEVTGDGRSHWTARGPAGKSVQWDAEITEDRPGELISWRSTGRATVPNSGTVRFADAPGGRGTEVRVSLRYDPPGGKAGLALARLLGEHPEQQVRDDLRRFKQVMETGEVVRSEGSPEGTRALRQAVQRPAQPVG